MTQFCKDRKVFIRVTFSSFLRFKKGFESEPTLHSGINYAVLLLAAGHQFDTSFELRKVGELGHQSHLSKTPFRPCY